MIVPAGTGGRLTAREIFVGAGDSDSGRGDRACWRSIGARDYRDDASSRYAIPMARSALTIGSRTPSKAEIGSSLRRCVDGSNVGALSAEFHSLDDATVCKVFVKCGNRLVTLRWPLLPRQRYDQAICGRGAISDRPPEGADVALTAARAAPRMGTTPIPARRDARRW